MLAGIGCPFSNHLDLTHKSQLGVIQKWGHVKRGMEVFENVIMRESFSDGAKSYFNNFSFMQPENQTSDYWIGNFLESLFKIRE